MHGNLNNKNALKYSNEQIDHQIENIKAISKKISKMVYQIRIEK